MIHPFSPHIELEHGLYYENRKRYLDIFGRSKVKIIIFEKWIKNPNSTIQEILQFLDIDYSITNLKYDVHNPFFIEKPRGKVSQNLLKSKTASKIARKFIPSNGRRFIQKKVLTSRNTNKPKLDNADREFLIKFYQNDVKKLKRLLVQELPWPNFQD